MKKNILFFAILFLAFSSHAQSIVYSLMHDGETREYQLYLPDNYEEGMSLPLIINMHGFGSDRAAQAFYANFSPIADEHNFIVVSPQGLVRNFGEGDSTHWNAYFGTDVDDVGFLSSLIDVLYNDYGIDLSRVYATGMSNGGFMSYVLACELNDRIAAIASVTGSMRMEAMDNCMATIPVPVMEIHGTADGVVPYNGNGFSGVSIPEVVDFWVANNACDETVKETTDLPNTDMNDNSTVSLEVYPSCSGEVEVHFYTVDNGGHAWPGAFPVPGLGNTNNDFKASVAIWEFFSQYEHPSPRAVTTGANDLVVAAAVELFPNPFDEKLTLQNKGNLALESIQLYDALGQLLWQQKTPTNVSSLDIATPELDKGIYFLSIKIKDSLHTRKLVKF